MRRCDRVGKSHIASRSLRARAYLVESLENRTLFAVGTLVGSTVNLNSQVGPDAADPVRDVAYVVDQGNSQIDAIDTDTGTLAATAPTAATAQGLTVSADDTVLYASEPTAFQVEVFSLPSLTLSATLNTGIAINQIVGLANGRFAGVDSSGIQIFDGTTGAVLYTVSNATDELLRANAGGTILYSREIGPTFNFAGMLVAVARPVHDWNTSGAGIPVALANLPAPDSSNAADFAVNSGSGFDYAGDLDLGGVGVTLLSSGSQTTYPGGTADTVAALDGGQYLYSITTGDVAEQFNRQGTELATLSLTSGHTAASLVETPNGVLVYTFGTGVGIINEQNLNLTGLPHLVFDTQPGDTISGYKFIPTLRVSVEDSAGDVLRSDSSTVTLNLAGGAGSLGGTTSAATVNGVATFPNLSVIVPAPTRWTRLTAETPPVPPIRSRSPGQI